METRNKTRNLGLIHIPPQNFGFKNHLDFQFDRQMWDQVKATLEHANEFIEPLNATTLKEAEEEIQGRALRGLNFFVEYQETDKQGEIEIRALFYDDRAALLDPFIHRSLTPRKTEHPDDKKIGVITMPLQMFHPQSVADQFDENMRDQLIEKIKMGEVGIASTSAITLEEAQKEIKNFKNSDIQIFVEYTPVDRYQLNISALCYKDNVFETSIQGLSMPGFAKQTRQQVTDNTRKEERKPQKPLPSTQGTFKPKPKPVEVVSQSTSNPFAGLFTFGKKSK